MGMTKQPGSSGTEVSVKGVKEALSPQSDGGRKDDCRALLSIGAGESRSGGLEWRKGEKG